jgi:two-component system, NarL family, sensor kinase
MRSVIFFALCICYSCKASAQSNKIIDSLEKKARQQKDTTLIKTYNELTWEYRTINQNKAISYGKKAIAKSLDFKFDKGLAQAYNDLGIIYFDKQNFDSALYLYQQSLSIRLRNNDFSGVAKLYNKIGIVFQQQGQFDKALENQLNALRLFEQAKNDIGISYSLNNIGIINQNMGRYEDAIQYQLRSISIKEKLKDVYGLSGSYVNVGNIYLLQNNVQKAKEYYLKGVDLTRSIGDKEYLANALNNLARFYITTKSYTEAIPYVNESFSLRQNLNDKKGTVSCLINKAIIHTGLIQYDTAETTLNKALILTKNEIACKPELPGLYQAFSDLYEKQGMYDKALSMHRLFAAAKDSVYTTQLGNKFAELETKYETLQKERQIQEQKYSLERKNYWLWAAFSILVFVILLSLSAYRRHKLKQETKLQATILKQQALATRAILEAEETERQRIAKDLHDGVGQMMSVAKMNLSAVESKIQLNTPEQKNAFENIIQLVDDSCKEIRSISHNMMPNALLKNNLSLAIQEFIDKLDQRVLKVHVYTEGLDERLDSNVETVLYRIVQECVNNVIKHSGADTLDITIIKEVHEVTATIEDNGRGFNVNENGKLEGIGLKNIRSRIGYLKGTVDFDSSPGNGTLIALHVPLQ